MARFRLISIALAWLCFLALSATQIFAEESQQQIFRIGIIGLDTSHVTAFTDAINGTEEQPGIDGFRVVVAYPQGSADIESSVSRVPKFTQEMRDKGVEIVDSIAELLTKVDGVLLETNDGRPHLEQLRPVIAAKKPVFIDKPLAGSLTEVVAIFQLARKAGVPLFSSSSLRFGKNTQAVRNGSIGPVVSCEASSPCHLEKTHPDLFWYGIHGVESLFTVLGTGCETVSRFDEEDQIVVEGAWSGYRTGIFREGEGYSGLAKGAQGEAEIGSYDGYEPLVKEIVKFFKTGKPPVSEAETLEIYAFMQAADVSKHQQGSAVKIADVLAKAQREAAYLAK